MVVRCGYRINVIECSIKLFVSTRVALILAISVKTTSPFHPLTSPWNGDVMQQLKDNWAGPLEIVAVSLSHTQDGKI
jgi:hypothetical protein